jgi:hypothetical protein
MTAGHRATELAVYHGEKNVSGERVAKVLGEAEVPFGMIVAGEIESGRLTDFAGVVFPGGHSIGLKEEGVAEVIRFVEAGGGFLGICAGCQFGMRIGILPVRWKPLRASGIFDMRVARRHPVTRGYELSPRWNGETPWRYSQPSRVRMRYCNGGLLSAAPPAAVIVAFDEEDAFGAVVAGKRGRGNVVLISSHPESTPPPSESGVFASDADASQDPLPLFLNAARWVVGMNVAS